LVFSIFVFFLFQIVLGRLGSPRNSSVLPTLGISEAVSWAVFLRRHVVVFFDEVRPDFRFFTQPFPQANARLPSLASPFNFPLPYVHPAPVFTFRTICPPFCCLLFYLDSFAFAGDSLPVSMKRFLFPLFLKPTLQKSPRISPPIRGFFLEIWNFPSPSLVGLGWETCGCSSFPCQGLFCLHFRGWSSFFSDFPLL